MPELDQIKTLPYPPIVFEAQEAREVVQGVLCDGQIVIYFDPTAFENPAAWGVFLADFLGHVSSAMGQMAGEDPQVFFDLIKEAFEAELKAPTSETTGTLQKLNQ